MVPAGTNNTKPPCPAVNGTAVPAIRPVVVPQIVSLQGGQILIGSNSSQPQPTQIKVPHLALAKYKTLLCVSQPLIACCS